MSEDMSQLINQINNMMQNNEIPEEIKNMVNHMKNSTQNTNSNENKQDVSSNQDSSNENSIPEFDVATIMKMKSIMDSMKVSKNDPRANLLKSLKPYLKESRKEKVDQYIQIFGMGKVLEMLRSVRW